MDAASGAKKDWQEVSRRYKAWHGTWALDDAQRGVGLLHYLDDELCSRPARLSITHISRAPFAPVGSGVILSVTPIGDPQRYFIDVLTRLVNGWPNGRIDELMLWCWAANDPS